MPNITRNNIGRIITSKIGGLLSGKKVVSWLVVGCTTILVGQNPWKSGKIPQHLRTMNTSINIPRKNPENPSKSLEQNPWNSSISATMCHDHRAKFLTSSSIATASALSAAQSSGRRTFRQRTRPRFARVDAMARRLEVGWKKTWIEPWWTMDWYSWDLMGLDGI